MGDSADTGRSNLRAQRQAKAAEKRAARKRARELRQTSVAAQAASRPVVKKKEVEQFFDEAAPKPPRSGRRPPIEDLPKGSGLIENVVKGAGKAVKGVTREAVESFMMQANADAPRRGGIANDPRVRGAGAAAKATLDFQIGPDARKALTGQDFNPWLAVGGGILGVTPFKGSAGLGKAAAGTRALRFGEKVQQLPRARSRFTQTLIEKPADKASLWIAKEDSKAAKAVSKVLRTAGAGPRVAKGAGREVSAEQGRKAALMYPFLKELPKQGSPEDVAHFWWAQLPQSHRNIAGLNAIRGILADELKTVATTTPGQTRKIQTLTASLTELDKVIKANPELNPKVIKAVQELSRDRKDVLIAAGILDEGRATNREGLVPGMLGLDPEDAAFVGHRMAGKPVRGSRTGLPGGGTGKPRMPEGVSKENKLALLKSGQLRPTTHVVAEDWLAAQTYRNALAARKDLALMGEKYPGYVPDGYVLVNPRGQALLPGQKTDMLPYLTEATEEEVRAEAHKIMRGFLAESDEDIAAMLNAVPDDKNLRVVKKSIMKRYYGQFVPAGYGTVGGRALDTATDYMAASIIFARLGYIPKNIAQNLIMTIPHQGVYALANIARAGQLYHHPELRKLVEAEVGFSGVNIGIGDEMVQTSRRAKAGKRLKGAPHTAAGIVGGVADTPLRMSAFLHEAAAEGVIPRMLPFLRDQDVEALTAFLTHKNHRATLNDVRWRSSEAMGDFSRLTPTQRKWARRFLIIPGWLWAGSRYPVHFAATHPGRSAAIAYAAAGAPGAEDRIGYNLPPITDKMAKGLPYYVQGIETPWGVERTTSLSPVSTPWEAAGAAIGFGPRTIGSYANPMAAAGWNVANKQIQGPYGTYSADSYRDAARAAGERLAPNYSLFEDLYSPPQNDPRYPGDKTRLGRLKRELGILPIEITRDKPTGAKAKNAAAVDDITAAIPKFLPKKYQAAAQKDLKAAYERKTVLDEQRARIQKDTESGRPYDEATFPAELDLAVQWKLITPKIAAERKKWMATASDEELDDEIRYFRDNILSEHLNTITDIKGALEFYGWKPSEK